MLSSDSPLRLPLLLVISVLLFLPSIIVHATPLRYGSRYDVLERRGCGTHIDLEARWEMEEGLLQAHSEHDLYAREDVGGKDKDGKTVKPLKPVSFDVYWHVVYANETKDGGYVTDDQINSQMTVLNDDFKSTNISWTLKNITRIQSDDWFVNVWPGSPQEQEMKKQYHKGDSSALNIFTAQFNITTKSLGFASLPSAYLRQPLSDGLIIRHSTLPGGTQPNYNHGRTTVHEVGHWLGLYHTFEGGCEGVGDNIDDTAPEASESVGCPVGRKSCPGSKLEDPVHNFMDYSWDTCMTHFTPGQAKRMHEVVWAYRTKRPPSPSSPCSTAPATSPTSNPAAANTSSSVSNSPSSTARSASTFTTLAPLIPGPTATPDSQEVGQEAGEDGVAVRLSGDEEFERAWELYEIAERALVDDEDEYD